MQAVKRLKLSPGQQPNEDDLVGLLKYIAGLYESKTTKRLRGEGLYSLLRNGLAISWEDTAYVLLLHLIAAGLSSSALGTLLQCGVAYATCGPRWLLKPSPFSICALATPMTSTTARCQCLEGTSITMCFFTILTRSCTSCTMSPMMLGGVWQWLACATC